ncbi:MAG: Gfo/Idh/MocA family oxidoreductase [Anaerolineae bacterium]
MANPQTVKTYNVAIVGTGAIAASNHVPALRAAGDRVKLVAAMDVDATRAQEFAAKFEIPQWFTDVNALLETAKPDLVVICTPPATHVDLSIACLEAGAHVLCEKPLARSIADFDRLIEAEKRSGKTVSTVFQWRFGSAAQHYKKLIDSGEYGKPLVGHCLTLWYRDFDYYAVPWRGKWATELGGPTMGHGIHLTDLFLWLYGDWDEVRAMMGTLDRPIEVEDVSMALVRFSSGAMGSITNSVLSPRQETYLRLDLQKLTIELSALYSANNDHWRVNVPNVPQPETNITGGHTAQVAALLDSLDRGEMPLVTGNEARRIIEFSSSLYKSAITGTPVQRGSIAAPDPFYYAMNGQPVETGRG